MFLFCLYKLIFTVNDNERKAMAAHKVEKAQSKISINVHLPKKTRMV